MTATTLTTTAQQARKVVAGALAGSVPVLHEASREELLALIGSTQEAINTLAAVQQQALAHFAAIEDVRDAHTGGWIEQHRGLGHFSIGAPGDVAEVIGASETAAGNRMDDAIHQITITPTIHHAVTAGDLDPWRAHVITRELSVCPDDIATTVAEKVAAHYEHQGGWVDSAGPLKARVRRLILKHAPEVIADQAAQAVADRSVRRWVETEGTDHWEADLPVEASIPMWHAIDSLAVKLRANTPDLTLDQARADALTQLVLQQADVTIHLHATTPKPHAAQEEPSTPDGASGRVVELGGLNSQPVLADLDVMRKHVTLTDSTDLVCDPDTGAFTGGFVPKGLGHSKAPESDRVSDTYMVPADIARLVRLRDGRCRFPGCSVNARFCDLDHVIAWPAGATTASNLMCLCRRHHRVKQQPQWHVKLAPDGTTEWTTPTKHTRITHPVDHLSHATLPARAPTEPPTPWGSEIPDHRRFIGDRPGESLLELTFARVLELAGMYRITQDGNATGDPPF